MLARGYNEEAPKLNLGRSGSSVEVQKQVAVACRRSDKSRGQRSEKVATFQSEKSQEGCKMVATRSAVHQSFAACCERVR